MIPTLMKHCMSGCEKAFLKNVPVSFTKKSTSILSSIIILLLPKCPFCLVAYSSAVTLCSASGVITNTQHHNDWGAYVAVVMGSIITTIILTTFKTRKSSFLYMITLIIALCGSVLIYIGGFKAASMTYYYIGSALLIVATLVYSDAYSHLKSHFKPLNK